MATHTVKQLARASGVSVRTLHYYDEIGLLRPARTGANGYRYYGPEELLRLQQILLHRELGLPLEAIGALLNQEGSRIERLQEHRQQLLKRADHYRDLIATVDRTIAALKGDQPVNTSNLYRGFTPEKQAEYEDFIVDRYGKNEAGRQALRKDIDRSRAQVEGFTDPELAQRMASLAEVEAALAGHCQNKTAAGDPALDVLLGRHRAWVAEMWGKPCTASAYAGLADLYESHPDFRARYEQLAPGFADYLPAAMRAYSRTVST
jgi:DNA-binding transcriptional MerR regulator